MNENQMTESVGEVPNIGSLFGNDLIENVSNQVENKQTIEKTNFEIGIERKGEAVAEKSDFENENQSAKKSETVGVTKKIPSQLDAEKGMELMLGGTDGEITEYFGKQGIQTDDILKERKEFLNHVKEKMFQDDLNELQKEFSFVTASKIQEIPNFDKFAKLRASGLTAIESFEGACGKLISMEYLKNRDEFSYSHLKSTGLKGSATGGIPIPKDEVAIWKSAFPNDTFTQLTKRYNKTKFN